MKSTEIRETDPCRAIATFHLQFEHGTCREVVLFSGNQDVDAPDQKTLHTDGESLRHSWHS